LAIVRSVVADLGGRAWAEHAHGGGARLCVTVPLVEPAPPNEPVERPVPLPPARVAIVDDSAEVRSVVAAVLEAEGAHVVAELDGGSGTIAKVAEVAPDVVLLDQGLGVDAGTNLIPAVKSAGAPVVVLMSGAMTLALQRDAVSLGADAAVDKANLFQLTRLIDELRRR
jgi:CheY-like chemotaxis protein